MSFIFDSSAIINLCGDRKAEKLLDGWTLNLAIYELGNAVWKQVKIHGKITVEEADLVLDSLTEVFRRLRKPAAENPVKTLEIAVKEDLTYYDASYIRAAVENNLALVTDDDKLYKSGKKHVRTVKSNEL